MLAWAAAEGLRRRRDRARLATCWSPTRATTASRCGSRERSPRSRSTARACAAAAGHRWRRSSRRSTEAALDGHRVRLRHPGNGGRCGAHERRRLRQRDPRRAGARPRSSRRAARAAAGRDELELSYRHSNVRSSEVVAEATFALERGVRDEIRARVREMQRQRSSSQPRKARTFGSVFKNPAEGPGAGRADRGLRAQGPRHRRRVHLHRARQLHREHGQRALGGRRGAGHARPELRARALSGRSGARSGAARACQPGLNPPTGWAGGAAHAPKRGACSSPPTC